MLQPALESRTRLAAGPRHAGQGRRSPAPAPTSCAVLEIALAVCASPHAAWLRPIPCCAAFRWTSPACMVWKMDAAAELAAARKAELLVERCAERRRAQQRGEELDTLMVGAAGGPMLSELSRAGRPAHAAGNRPPSRRTRSRRMGDASAMSATPRMTRTWPGPPPCCCTAGDQDRPAARAER